MIRSRFWLYAGSFLLLLKRTTNKLLTALLKTINLTIFEEALRKLKLSNDELFDGFRKAYEKFIQKVMGVTDNLVPSKSKLVNPIHHKIGLMLTFWKKQERGI